MNSKQLTTIRDKEIVIQSNSISRGIYTCSPLARKLISYCILKTNHYPETIDIPNMPDIEVMHHFKSQFTISEFITKLGIARGSNTYKQVKRAVEELSSSIIQIENTEEKYKAYTWFSSATYDKEKDLIELEFNPQIGLAVLDWKVKKQFSAMNIKTIGEIQSFYALRYFEIACSFYNMKGRYGNKKDQWTFSESVDELKTMFKIDKDAYKDRMNNFITKVVKNPIDELNSVNKDFQITYTKIVENHKTVGFEFTCEQSAAVMKIEASDSDELKQDKTIINEEKIELEYYKTKYPLEWQAAMDKLQAETASDTPVFGVILESEAVEMLKDQGLG